MVAQVSEVHWFQTELYKDGIFYRVGIIGTKEDAENTLLKYSRNTTFLDTEKMSVAKTGRKIGSVRLVECKEVPRPKEDSSAELMFKWKK